jgi:hypothetical protein
MPSGFPNTIQVTFTVNDGDALELDYYAPLLPGDASFRLFDSEGILLYDAGLAPITEDDVYTETVMCPTCPAPTNLIVNNIQPRDVDLQWTTNGSETQWIVEYSPSPYTPGSGGVEEVFTTADVNIVGSTVTASLGDGTGGAGPAGLTPETEYDVYVRAVCDPANNEESANRGPATFETTASCPRIISFTPGTATANEISFNINDAQGNTETDYTVYYGPSPISGINDPNVDIQTGTTAAAPAPRTITVNGLFSNTSYDFIVVLNCGPGDDSQPSVTYTAATPQVCPNISNVIASNVTRNSVELAWTNNGSSTEWEILFAPDFVIEGDPATQSLTVNTNPFTLTGLDSSTDYQICIRAICGPLDRSDLECVFVETIPDYCAGDLLLDSGGAMGNYGNDENITYTICPDNPGDIVYVNFTEFNLQQGSNSTCFDYITIYDGEDVTAPIIRAPRGAINSRWCFNRASGTGTGDLTQVPLFSTSPSGCLTFVFTSDSSISASGFAASVTCAPPPTCPAPTDLSITQIFGEGAVFNWNANAGETEWEVEVQPAGVPQGTSPAAFTATSTTNPAGIDGLTPGTAYDAYVRAVCDPTDQSTWSGPETFTTGCATETAPYFWPFTTDIDACWALADNRTIAENPIFTTSNAWDFFDFANEINPPSGNAAYITVEDDNRQNNDWLITPMIDLGAAGHGLGVQFDVAVTDIFVDAPGTWGSDDKVELLITENLGVSWRVLKTYDSSSMISHTGQTEDINLAGITGKVRFAFKSDIGTVADTDGIDFYVDNFQVDATNSSGSVDIAGLQFYPNPVNDLLNLSAPTTIDSIEVFNLMGQRIYSQEVDNLSIQLDMSSYSSGLYLVRVTSGEAVSTIKIARE